MSVLGKAADVADDVMVGLIQKASEKQQRVNALLEAKGANVRIGYFEVQMGAPPSVVYGISPVSGL